MSGVLAHLPRRPRSLRVVVPAQDDRWTAGSRRRSAMTQVLVLSAALHGALLVGAGLFARTVPPPAPRDIAVELVPEVPRPRDVLEPAKAPPVDGKPIAAKPSGAEPKPVETEPAQPAGHGPVPRREAEAPRPAPPASSREPSEREAMRDELARLKAEQAALQAERQAPALPDTAVPAGTAAGPGPLASAFSAIALPEQTGDGDLVGYASVVFGRLAAAKAIGGEMGRPGTAGVSFAVDDGGALVDLRLAVSSGIAELDAEALAVVRKAAPFPPPPPGAQRAFSANVSFVAGRGR